MSTKARNAEAYRVVAAWLTQDLPGGEKREYKRGEVTSDLPEASLEWLLAQGYIVPATDEGSK